MNEREKQIDREMRYEEGRIAFKKGRAPHTLRRDKAWLGSGEPATNVDRLCGYIEAATEELDRVVSRLSKEPKR